MSEQTYLCVLEHDSGVSPYSVDSPYTANSRSSETKSSPSPEIQTGQTATELSSESATNVYVDSDIEFATAVELVLHQITDHHSIECAICGQTVPDGYVGLKHIFGEHNRAQYIRKYDTSAKYIRSRESAIKTIDSYLDFGQLQNEIDWDTIADPDHVKILLSDDYTVKSL